jgi:hypothetical protein
MSKRKNRVKAFSFLSLGIISVGMFVGCLNHTNKQPDTNEQQVSVTMKEEAGRTRVTCTFPQLTLNRVLYTVQTITISDASGKSLPANQKYRQPSVSFAVPHDKIADIRLDVLYIDAGALKESSTDPNKRIDWEVRWKQFKLSEILKNENLKNK